MAELRTTIAIHDLKRQGLSISAISRKTGLDRKMDSPRGERVAYGILSRLVGLPVANQAARASFGAEAGNLTGAFALLRRTMLRHASSKRPDFSRERNVRTP